MAILRYVYLGLGMILYIAINVVTYTNPELIEVLNKKIMFSVLSLALLVFDYACILWTKKLFNRPFKDFATYMKVTFYLGVIIFPLISLYE
ncbi:MAG: hypothetical protein K9L02_04620 [Acholeplasmataceae bacterium]|nr:hypothetical protein [Acholeplasmataceae bacterium]